MSTVMSDKRDQIINAQIQAQRGNFLPAISCAFASLGEAMGKKKWSWDEIEAFLAGSLSVVADMDGDALVRLLRGEER